MYLFNPPHKYVLLFFTNKETGFIAAESLDEGHKASTQYTPRIEPYFILPQSPLALSVNSESHTETKAI